MAYSMAMSPGFGSKPGLNSGVGFNSMSTPQPSALSERRFLSEAELASRWGMSPKTLTRWRSASRSKIMAISRRRASLDVSSSRMCSQPRPGAFRSA